MKSNCKLFAFAEVLIISTVVYSNASGVDANDKSFSYRDYAVVLKSCVDDAGMVNYKKLKAEPGKLDAFVTSMGRLGPNSYAKWSKNEKISFWLNAYNALTLKAIIDNYPIKPSFFRATLYPKNSIRQIPGVWDKVTFNVMGQDLTLGHIEHKILRKKFDEPRIHMAMVCAAMGCPPLRNEPYLDTKLQEQLDDQTRRFLSNPAKFRIDREKNRLYLSPILKWFAGDFVDKYSPQRNIAKRSKKASAVLNFIASYLKETEREYILKGKFRTKQLKYDWSLNEQQIKNKKLKHRENEP